MKRVLAAGCTGYAGRYTTKHLKEKGYWVRAITRDEARLDKPGPFGAPAIREFCDEVYVGQVTDPSTLEGAFEGIDAVFSAVGITRQRDGLTFDQVDYQANKNLVDLAVKHGARKFVYVSIWDPQAIAHLEIVRAHEKVVQALEESGLDYTVVRPTGYFSDMGILLDLAKRGRSFVIGDGSNRLNPIHGDDLGRICAEAVESTEREIGAGGPDVLTQREAAELAFEVVGKPPKIVKVPVWLVTSTGKMVGLLSKQFGDLIDFFATAGAVNAVAPSVGRIHLRDYFKELAER